MEGIHSAETDSISGSHLNLTGLELATGESHEIQNGGSSFVRHLGFSTSNEPTPEHPMSNSENTCWAPSDWDHSCRTPESEAGAYAMNRLGWHLKSSAWDFNVSDHSGPRSDVMRRANGSNWGTQNEGFVLEGAILGTTQKTFFSVCSGSNNECASNFAASTSLPCAAMTGNSDLIGSSSCSSESEKPCKRWVEQGSELTVPNSSHIDSSPHVGRSSVRTTKNQYQTREQNSTVYLNNVQTNPSSRVHVLKELKLGDVKGGENVDMPRGKVTVGDASMGLRLGKRTYFEDAVEAAGTSRGQAPASTPPVFAGSSSVKKQRILAPGVHVPRCQVEGCKEDLRDAKDYHRRHKVCERHSKAPKVIAKGMEQRFCQQCSRFHLLSHFDESKRSCRRRLADHNERRRKPSHDTSALVAASINQDRATALNGVLDRSYLMQYPLAVRSVLDEPGSMKGWSRYDKLGDNNQVTLACSRMEVMDGGLSIHRHAADRLLMLQGPNSSSSPALMQQDLYVHAPSSIDQGRSLSQSTGPAVLANSLSSPGLTADCGRALSLLSSQSLPSNSNTNCKLMDQNHHHTLPQDFTNSRDCGATTQSGFAASGEEKLFGLSLTDMDHKEQDQTGSLISCLGDPMLAHLLQGQTGFRSLNSQQTRPTLDLMQVPSHSHHMGIQDGNGTTFPELHSLRSYETSIFEHQQMI